MLYFYDIEGSGGEGDMPQVTCRHGVKIFKGWWECGNCVRDNGLSRADVDALMRDSERLEQEIRQSRNKSHESTPEENRNGLFLQILATFWAGFWFSLLVGIAGCSVRLVGFRQDYPLRAFLFESIVFYVLFLIWGIRDAYKTFGPYK